MDLAEKKVVLVGMGRSTTAAARLLLREGARPFITESSDAPRLDPWRAQCLEMGVSFELGGHTMDAFEGAEMVVTSPGVPLASDLLAPMRVRGIPIIGELELASRFCRSRIIALTGTNGKTTATELLRAMIAACGRTVDLAGNNDRPLSLVALLEDQPEFVVVEASSYQLETAGTFHPWIAAALNVTPDHLKRHGTMEGYSVAKTRIFRCQGPGDIAVVNAGDPFTRAMKMPAGVDRIEFSLSRETPCEAWMAGDGYYLRGERLAETGDNPLPGRHNAENVLCALAMLAAGGFDRGGMVAGLRAFKGVEHRIEHVLAENGVDWYNDSKSTNVDSLRVALESFNRPLVLIAGGQAKDSDYRVIRDLFAVHVKHMVAIGDDAPRFAEAYGDLAPWSRADSMDDAVARARRAAAPGDVVLLSPGCASFDWYGNFEERGRDFKRAVRTLCGGARTGADTP